MAVIPKAVVNKKAGEQLIKSFGQEHRTAVYIMYAMLDTASAAFRSARGTMLDMYREYSDDYKSVDDVCREFYGAGVDAVEKACGKVFSLNRRDMVLECGDERYDMLDVSISTLFYGGVIVDGSIVGVIDDKTRDAVRESMLSAGEIVSAMEADGGSAHLASIGEGAAMKKYGSTGVGRMLVRTLFSEGAPNSYMLESTRDGFAGMADAMDITGSGHPEIGDTLIELAKREYIGSDDDIDNSIYADSGAEKSRRARVKTAMKFKTDFQHAQQFVFTRDIGAAEDYLRRQGMPATPATALNLLTNSFRTGDERFPRWGMVIPEKNLVGGSRDMMLGGKSGVDQAFMNLYGILARLKGAILVSTMLGENVDDTEANRRKAGKLRDEICSDMYSKGVARKEFDYSDGENVDGKTRIPYSVTFDDSDPKVANAKMAAVMRVLGRAATGIATPQSTALASSMGSAGKDDAYSEEKSLNDRVEASMASAMEHGAIESNTDPVREVVNAPSIYKVVSAASNIFREFRSLAQTSQVYKDNKELFDHFDEHYSEIAQNGGNTDLPIDEGDAAMLAVETLRALVGGVGRTGVRFFDASKFDVGEKMGLPYVSNWGFTGEASVANEKYIEAMARTRGSLLGAKNENARIAYMFPYQLLVKKYGAENNPGISGAIRDLVGFESDITQLPEFSSGAKRGKTFGEFVKAATDGAGPTAAAKSAALSTALRGDVIKVNMANLGKMISDEYMDFARSRQFDELARVLFLRKYPEVKARKAFYKEHLAAGDGDMGEMTLGLATVFGVASADSFDDIVEDVAKSLDSADAADAMRNSIMTGKVGKADIVAMFVDYAVTSMLPVSIRSGQFANIGLVIASSVDDLLGDDRTLTAEQLRSDSRYAAPVKISGYSVKDGKLSETEMEVGPVFAYIDGFLGARYGMGDSFVAGVGDIVESGDKQKLAKLVRGIYNVDRDRPEHAVVTIAGLRPTSRPDNSTKLNVTLGKRDMSGEVARDLRGKHDEEWMRNVMARMTDGDDYDDDITPADRADMIASEWDEDRRIEELRGKSGGKSDAQDQSGDLQVVGSMSDYYDDDDGLGDERMDDAPYEDYGSRYSDDEPPSEDEGDADDETGDDEQ